MRSRFVQFQLRDLLLITVPVLVAIAAVHLVTTVMRLAM